MLFNSFDFVIFLPIVFGIYWLLKGQLKIQNTFLLISSYFFYGYWDWRFLGLILLSTLIDFGIGINLSKTVENQTKRKVLLMISLVANLGMLMLFKYYNFFLDSFEDAFSFFGHPIAVDRLNIVLPVGISFYTFQTLSYTIDVYRNKIKANNDFIAFASFVSFFPQLVAGPIERAEHLLPQFSYTKKFDYTLAVEGLRQILFGFFKKMVIADNCASFVNESFGHVESFSSFSLWLGAIMFAFQIYGDFSGYSDIAIGTAKLFGFKLNENFNYPYFSRDIAEFWRRWHISLSTWFRDYLYIPLGGSKTTKIKVIRNTFVIFIVSGFWHGANWTFIIWGLLNALYFMPMLLMKRNRKNIDIVANNSTFPSLYEVFGMGLTFFMSTIAWVFFRAESVSKAWEYIKGMFSSLSSQISFDNKRGVILMFFLIVILILFEWLGRKNSNTLQVVTKLQSRYIRWSVYFIILFLIGMYAQTNETAFIYFQF